MELRGFRVMKIHELKIYPEYFRAQLEGRKSFEIRKDDREFKVGDVLVLMEVEPTHSGSDERPTGRKMACEVTYKTDYEQQEGYVVLSTIRI